MQPHPVISTTVMEDIGLKMQRRNLLMVWICGHKCVSLQLNWDEEDSVDVKWGLIVVIMILLHAQVNKLLSWGKINRRLEARTSPAATFLHGERSLDKGSCCRWGRRSWCGGLLRWQAASVSTDWPGSSSPRGSAVKKTPEQRTQVGWQRWKRCRMVQWLFSHGEFN